MTYEDSIVHISKSVLDKLRERDIEPDEVEEALFNSSEPYPVDKRPEHRTDPPTLYFIAPTFEGRYLKVVFIHRKNEQQINIKSAYEPEPLDFVKYLEQGGKLPWV